jgi:hypothetical protein
MKTRGVTASLPLHHPTVCGYQTRGQSLLSGAALSNSVVVDDGTFGGGVRVRSPRVWIFDVVLTVCVAVLLNPTWRSSLLSGHAYPTSEISWQLCV